MPELHHKKKIEIIIEQIRSDAVIEVLEAAGAKGYTILRKVTGKGNRGIRSGGALPDIFGNVQISTIVSQEVADRILAESDRMLEDTAGIVVVSDVQVLRPEHF